MHLVKVHLTNHKWGCMYAFEPVIFSEMMQFPQAQDGKIFSAFKDVLKALCAHQDQDI